MNNLFKRLLGVVLALTVALVLVSCGPEEGGGGGGGTVVTGVTVNVELPENTPEGDSIYVVGTFEALGFEDWNPGLAELKLTRTGNTATIHLDVELPEEGVTVQFKFTRGDWDKVEGNASYGQIDNRQLKLLNGLVLNLTVLSWEDLRPENEPVVLVEHDFGSEAVTGYGAGDLTWTNKDGKEFVASKDRVQINTSDFAPHNNDIFLVFSIRNTAAEAWMEFDLRAYSGLETIKFDINTWNNSIIDGVKNLEGSTLALQVRDGANWVDLEDIGGETNILPLLTADQYVEVEFAVDGPGLFRILYAGTSAASGNTTHTVTVDNFKALGQPGTVEVPPTEEPEPEPEPTPTPLPEGLRTMAWPGGSTTNMAEGNNAALVGLEAEVFTVLSSVRNPEDASPLHVGLNTAGDMRLYGHADYVSESAMTVLIAEGKRITKIEITYKVGSNSPTKGQLILGDNELVLGAEDIANVTKVYDDLSIDGFKIRNIQDEGTKNTQIWIASIVIHYEDGVAENKFVPAA